MMTGVSRHQGETTEQWFHRATSNYRQAWDAMTVASKRRGMPEHIDPESRYPLGDELYDAAMDDLEAADDDRTEASIALNRERHPS
jgi:hypothetical protein